MHFLVMGPCSRDFFKMSLHIKERCCFRFIIIKPDACGQHMPGFLKLLWLVYWYVCVCVSTPEGIKAWYGVI